jgi:hypothetical protein
MNRSDYPQGSPGAREKDKSGDDALESLFSHVPARKRAPEEDESAIRQALHSEWRDLVRRKQRRRYFVYGIAASFLLGAVISINMFSQAPPAPLLQQVAVVEKQSGNIFIHQLDEQSSDVRRMSNGTLYGGQVLATTQSARLAILMNSGESVRIDENTRLAFVSEKEIELQSGRIYVDSQLTAVNANPDESLLINTHAGVIQHLGTQYMTHVGDSSVVVSVREGQVLVANGDLESIANPGQQISVSPGGKPSVKEISTYGKIWQWAELVTPEFNLDGRSAFDFIHWVGRETGRVIQFSTDEAEQLARSTELRGSIDLEPVRALDLILQTSDLVPEVEEDTIVIRQRTES